MSPATSTVRTHRVAVPAQVAETSEARKADYSTAVRLDGGPGASPEQWARGCLEGAPGWLRAMLVLGWTKGLRLRLGPRRSPTTVLGWYVIASTDQQATISAGSPLLECQHHFVRDGDTITWVTVVRTHTKVGRLLWRAIAPGHELSMPILLKRASRLA
ncbi:DUF2867 domain-containing protein [uncultured Jatrophihabitans sp.]|uniref:DUF2867 domain-containing protein n=1 Tax=uncultured Jatrophihabitans sp. TaxID=1610747 RepID=UPI0035CBA637